MEDLKGLVMELQGEYDREKQVLLLQKIGGLLITDYVIEVKGVVIEPLWAEAYYFHEGKFEDFNCHRRAKQKNSFGKLYLHTEKKITPSNRLGGVDIVLSMGDYCLSFLVKNSLCRGEFLKQVALNALLSGLEYDINKSENVLVKRRREHEVFCTERIGLTKESFRKERLAFLPIDRLRDFPFRFKERITIEYLQGYGACHNETQCAQKCLEILGRMPRKVKKALEEKP